MYRIVSVVLAGLGSLAIGSSATYAGNAEKTLTEAIDREDKAHNDYYRGLRKLGPQATEQQKAQLRDETIGAARQDVGRGIQELEQEREKSGREFFTNLYVKAFAENPPLWLSNPIRFLKELGRSDEGKIGEKEDSEPGDAELDAEVEKELLANYGPDPDTEKEEKESPEVNEAKKPASPPDITIDPNGVARELHFSGKKRLGVVPSPSPSPSVLKLDGKDGVVKELKFPGKRK